RQSLRTCVDRWNQGNMLRWGPTLAHVSAHPHCSVSLAVHYRRDPQRGCSGRPTLPGYDVCLDPARTYKCEIGRDGGYALPTHAGTALVRLRDPNAVSNDRGVLTLDIPLKGTHPTALLAWQRRYPHTDGWIDPWTPQGELRKGLTLIARQSGSCSPGS